MFAPNLDLLQAVNPHHPDGTPKDAHARHRQAIVIARRAQRRAMRKSGLAALGRRLQQLFLPRAATARKANSCAPSLR